MAGWLALARGVGAVAGAGGAAAQEFRNLIPQLEDEVTVEVVGQPGADKKRLYYLALAAANGIVRRNQEIVTINPLIPPPLAMLMIEYDAADHWVRCTLRYKTGTLNTAVGEKLFRNLGGAVLVAGGVGVGADIGLGVGARARDGAVAGGPRGDTQPGVFGSVVYTGPECTVVGGQFNFVGTIANFDTGIPGVGTIGGVSIPGIPESSKSPEAPQLEFENRTILTACPTTSDPTPGFGPPLGGVIPSPNPKPPGDNRSRGAVPVPKDVSLETQLTSQISSTIGILGLSLPQATCCEKSLALVPLVFAALSNPGSFDDMVYERPTQGPTGK